MEGKILLAVSSQASMDDGRPTGTWMEELAAPYWEFTDAGYTAVIASPKGGKGPVDPLSLDDPWLTAYGRRFLADAEAVKKLADTVVLSKVEASTFDALYCVGGAATAWDFPNNSTLAAIVESLFGAGRPVAGVCHGVLGLTLAKTADGHSIIKGKDVTGLSNAEEIVLGLDKLVPMLPQDRLTSVGGRFSCAVPFECHVKRDGNVLTGQNPASAAELARAVISQLGSKRAAA
jgi:putative intracellular protease/amidase